MGTPFSTLKNKPKPYIMAHRGNQVECPENTLAAFKHAIDDGANIIETDIQLTADNEFVCIHDTTIDRTTNGNGRVSEMTLANLKNYSASYSRDEFKSERIPTLAELANLLPNDVVLALELKSDRFKKPDTCKKLVTELDRAGIRNRTVVLSYSITRLNTILAVAPDIVTGLISIFNPLLYLKPQLLGPFWPLLLINPFYTYLAHKRSQVVCPFDTKPEKRLWLYRWLRCDAVLTNDPGKTSRVLKHI
jgi:glycerophosphoryl diester phosphodiesterase